MMGLGGPADTGQAGPQGGIAMSRDRTGRGRDLRGCEVASDGSINLPSTQHLLVELIEPRFSRFVSGDTRLAWLWILIRTYVGWQWLVAGWEKWVSPAWVGAEAGAALGSFIRASLGQMTGPHPNVQAWYGSFLQGVVMPHAALFSYIVTFGELAVGTGLLLGALTGIAALFGAFMNVNYLLAGAVGINPILLLLSLFLLLAWRVAGWYGLDRWFLPWLGTPWQPGPVQRTVPAGSVPLRQ